MSQPTLTPSAPGNTPNMWSKLRFSIIRITTCLIGVLVSTVGPDVNVGTDGCTTERGDDGVAAEEPSVDAVDAVQAATMMRAALATRARRGLRVIGVGESIGGARIPEGLAAYSCRFSQTPPGPIQLNPSPQAAIALPLF